MTWVATEISPYSEAYQKDIFDKPVFGLSRKEKAVSFLTAIKHLCLWHFDHNEQYQRILQTQGFFSRVQLADINELDQVPYIAVSLFKRFVLKSISDAEVFRQIQSSGTTSQVPSVVILDQQTAALQTKALVKIVQQFTGRARLPMLILDAAAGSSRTVGSNSYSARGAGVQGLSFLGRDHTYILDENLQLDMAALEAFCLRHLGQPILLFGFTYMVWNGMVRPLLEKKKQIPLPEGVLIHSGGWKKLQAQAVSNAVFKESLEAVSGIRRVHNFYGMAEQVGSVFMECEHGYLHAPYCAEILVRDVQTLASLGQGKQGLLQVVSLLPLSYPGHSLLTEDLGILVGEDDCPCGRLGKYFQVMGRLAASEIRGCSDTVSIG